MINLSNVAFENENTVICGDIHSNKINLINFLNESEVLNSTYKISLGDVVGYGDDPNSCIELIDDFFDIGILGNHDFGILSKNLEKFNGKAKFILEEQIKIISKQNILKLEKYIPNIKRDNIMLFHGSPNSNTDSLFLKNNILEMFENFSNIDLFIGAHLHYPFIFKLNKLTGKVNQINNIEDLITNEHNLDLNLNKYYISIPSLSEGRNGFNYPGYLNLHNLSKYNKKIFFNYIEE